MTSDEAPELPAGYTITDTGAHHELYGPSYDDTPRLVHWLPLGDDNWERLAKFARACASQNAGLGIPGERIELVYLDEPEGRWADEERYQFRKWTASRLPVFPLRGPS